MKTLLDRIRSLVSPRQLTAKDGMAFWKETILLNLFFAITVLGLVTYIPSVVLAVKEELWAVAIIDTLIYGGVLFIFFKPGLPFTLRAMAIPAISYILGMVLIFTLGPFGAGPVWLFFFPLITGLFLGRKMAFAALTINALTLALLGYLIHLDITDFLSSLNFHPWQLASENALVKWLVICLNFMLLNIVATLSVTTILNGLQKSMTDLAASENKYRQIFENILDVYFETRLDGTLVEVSPSIEKVALCPASQLKGQPLLKRYKNLRQRDEIIQLLLKNKTVSNYEVEFLDITGQVHICSVNARLLTDEATGDPKVVGILRDITPQKIMEKEKQALEDRLNRSQKMEAIGLLAGGVAHDLNNILSGIITYPELLAMDLDKNDPLRKSLNIIEQSGRRASEIVQDMLTLARRGVVTKESLDLNDLVLHFMRTPEYHKILSFHPDIQVKKEILAEFPLLKGSSIHLQKTLMNLISNAAESQPGGGIIIVRTANRHLDHPVKGYDQVEAGDYIVLSVEDHGIGIAEEDLPRIFEPFFTKKVMGRSGTGLGMAVVWGTVQDHEGYIDILSAPDKGTIFDLYFPITTDEMTAAAAPFRLEDYQGSSQKILIVDDVKEQRQIAAASLKKLGYHTVEMKSGEDAVAYLKQNHVDLILLDMIMDPGIDGLETYRQIQSFKPGQKAILASGFSRTDKAQATLELGAGAYLQKPYTLQKLGAAVRAELERSV